MASDLPTENRTASLVAKGLAVLYELIRQGLETYLRAEFPWLNTVFISWMFSNLMKYLEKVSYKVSALGTTFLVVDFQTSKEKDDFAESLKNFRQGVSVETTRKLKEAFDKGFHWDGAFKPK